MAALVSTFAALWFAASPSVPGPGTVAGQPDPQAIFGGVEVEPGAWPAVVGVRTSKLCTGTLVAPDLVLTAAHCFDPSPITPVQIHFGDAIDAGQVVSSDDWARHPDFCLPTECGEDLHDFAWVRLPSPVSGSAVTPIVPITTQAEFDEVMQIGAPLWMVGYGEDDDGGIGVKREVEASLTGFDESGREFRAGGDGKDTCYGDSGGPALVQLANNDWRLAGVISRGGECGQGGIYGVPLPELCWLRDSSGVDLLPAGCESCDCVMLTGEGQDEGCECAMAAAPAVGADERAPLALALGMLLVAGAGLRRARVRSYRRDI